MHHKLLYLPLGRAFDVLGAVTVATAVLWDVLPVRRLYGRDDGAWNVPFAKIAKVKNSTSGMC